MLALVGLLALAYPDATAAGERTYYVDCVNGSDNNSGLSTGQAWRSLAKANAATLLPGDSLLLARGCTWQGTLRATWNGTAADRILIGAYGTGAFPVIRNSATDLLDGAYNAVDVTGSYLILQGLEVTITNPPVVPGCAGNPVGFFIGFNFRNPDNVANGGSHNILRYSRASRLTAGVHFNNNTHDDQILNNYLFDNHVMSVLTPVAVNGSDDLGAWGILLKGHNQEVAYNLFSSNRAWCTFDTLPQGNAVEVYEAQNSRIHHNTSIDDRVFSELGGSAGLRADGNTFAYNLVRSSVPDARFIVARGSGNPFGPTNNTQVYNNTVYYTGADSQGIVCGAGCTSSILSAHNNIIWAEAKAIYGDAAFLEAHNLFWSTNGEPVVQLEGSALNLTSMITDPRFAAVESHDFKLRSNSPAIDAGQDVGWTLDLVNTAVPQGGAPDLGGYEFILAPLNLGYASYLPLLSLLHWP